MKITKKKNNKKALIIVGIVALLAALIAAASIYYFANQNTKNQEDSVVEDYNRNEVNLNPSTDEQQNAGSNIKKGALDKEDTKTPDNLTVSITAANQNDSTLQIRTSIDTVSTSGTCTVKLSGPSGKTVEKSAAIQALASNSTCQGFDIPTSELSVGTWKITVSATVGSSSGSTSQNIEIK